MNKFKVKVRTFKNDTSMLREFEVIAKSSFDAIVSALHSLNLKDARVSVSATPMPTTLSLELTKQMVQP